MLLNGQFLKTNVLQGNVATHLRYGGIFNDRFIANLSLSVNYFENKLWCEAQQTPPPAATYRMILTC